MPYSTGLTLPPGNFIFYAMRQITRSEAATESLLVHKPVQPMRLRAMVNQLLRSYERTIAPAAE